VSKVLANTSAARLWDHIGRPSINRQIPHARPVSAASSPAAQRTQRVCLAASPAQRYVEHTIFPCTVNLVRAPTFEQHVSWNWQTPCRAPRIACSQAVGRDGAQVERVVHAGQTRWRQRHPSLATAARLSSPWVRARDRRAAHSILCDSASTIACGEPTAQGESRRARK
jgi:hypothetical protein